jgi:ankyrin repeat protein
MTFETLIKHFRLVRFLIYICALLFLLFLSGCKSSQDRVFDIYDELGLTGLKAIIDKNPKLANSVRKGGFTILDCSVARNDMETTRYLLDKGADPNTISSTDPNMCNLKAAAYNGNLEMCKLLLEKGAAPEMGEGSSTGTALNTAARKGSLEIVKLLVSRGAKVDSQTDNGCTPFFVAALNGNVEVVKYLLAKGADKDVVVDGVTIEQEMQRRIQNGSATKEDAEILKLIQ